MKSSDRRKSTRLQYQFPAMLMSHLGVGFPIEGAAINVSQRGAFIKTKRWESFRLQDRAVVTFFIPPDFSGQSRVIGLQGDAVITRVDSEQEGIAVEFLRYLKQFQPITPPEVAGKIKYRKLATYLTIVENASLADFLSKNPIGFLVERSEKFFDREVIFKFLTEVAEETDVADHAKGGSAHLSVLDARVLEIKKRKSFNDPDTITIGRSPHSDIVLYNKLVSRTHAHLYVDIGSQGCTVADLGSTNGTFLNEIKLTPYERYQVTDGDIIRFGRETKVVYFSSKAFHSFLGKLNPAEYSGGVGRESYPSCSSLEPGSRS
jgi:hypothetical protein